MSVILGVIFHFIGGFASGSFYMPYKKVKGWSWESFWIVGGLFSWLIAPPVAAWLTIPGFADIIRNSSAAVLSSTFIMGLLWGIGGLTYGLGVRYLGVSLGSSIILGLCSVFGAIIPSIYYYYTPTEGKDTIANLLATSWGQLVLLGLAVCVIGIIICGKAGAMKDKELGESKTDASGTEFKIGIGL
jgi:L-rhamnose-H+ transport protein